MPSRRPSPPPPSPHGSKIPPIRRPKPSRRRRGRDRGSTQHQMPPSCCPPPSLSTPPMVHCGGGDDRISDLPDPILVSIVSLLPVRTLLATSVLSERWRTLWTHATRLDFNLCGDSSRDPTLPDRILDRVLTAHQPPTLPTCWIRDHSNRSTASRSLHRLIPLLTRKRITNLILDYRCWDDKFNPYKILTIPTLQHLSISHYSFLNRQPPSPDSIHLQSLRLNSTKLKDEALTVLISSAPLLTRLSLIHCDLLEHPHISSQTLTQLEIEYAPLLNSLNIDTPLLTTLMLNHLPYLTNVDVNAPSVSVLNTSTYYIGEEEEHVWRSPSNNTVMLHRLLMWPDEVLRNGDVFAKIRKLFISMNLSCCVDAEKLATVLHNCNNLRELGVINTVFLNWSSPTAFWAAKDPFFSLEHHMESFWVKGFTGRRLELDFITFIVAKGLRLKRVMISSYESKTLKTVKSALVKISSYESKTLKTVKSALVKATDLDIIIKHDKQT